MNLRHLSLIFVVLALLAGGYTAYWYEVAGRALAALEAWKTGEESRGATIRGAVSRSGFPFTITLAVKDFSYERAGVLRVTAPLVNITLPGLVPFRPTISADQISSFYFAKANYTLTTQKLSATFLAPWITPKTYRDTGYVVKLALYTISLDGAHKVALGNLMQEVSLRAKFMGPMPDISQKASLASWRDAGGMIDLDHLTILWGSLAVHGEGTLALDKNFQPAAALSVAVTGHEQALDVMREQGQLQPVAAGLIKAALKLLEDPDPPPYKPKEVKMPLTIQDNTLAAAGITLFTWEPYPWP